MSLEFVDFKVGFKSQTIEFEQWSVDATVEQVKQELEEQTSVPLAGQKLMWKGKILKDDNVTLGSLNVSNGKLIMMGSLPKEIQSVDKLDKKLEERKKLAPLIKAKPKQRPIATKPKSQYTFHKISVIDEFPNPEKARKILERLRDDKGIQGIMDDRRWSVGELIELTPFEKTILGYNRNAGQLIALRLRTDDLSGFRSYDSIRKVLLHELTHNVWGDHDDNFHALNRQLNKDVISLDWTAHGAHVLGHGDFYDPGEDDEMDQGATYEAGSYRLGTTVGSSSSKGGEVSLSPEERRERMARAAMTRLTKKEEQEMDNGCGSTR